MSHEKLPSETSTTSHTSDPTPTVNKREWPWRKYLTPLPLLLEYKYPGKGTSEDPYVLNWVPSVFDEEGKEEILDVEYPQTWKSGQKWIITAIGAISVLSVTMTSSMMSAAIFDIRMKFPGHSAESYIMITSIFILGFVVGPLVWAPASEVFGRRRMFIVTFTAFTAFNAACCGANTLEALLVFRFFAGTFGSSTLTSVGGVITDMFNAKERASAMGVFAVAPFLGPAIAPVCGSFLSEAAGWKWVAALLAFFSAILTVIGTIWLPETYEPVLLRRRATEMSKITGKIYRYSQDVKKPLVTKELFKKQLTVPWKILFTEPVAFAMAVYVSVVYAILYMQFTSFPIVFVQQRGWSPSIAGLAFIGLSVGSIFGLIMLGFMNKRYVTKLEANGGWLPPEERLPMVILGGILLPIGLFWFAWSSPNTVHWIVPILATVIFGAALVGLFLGIMSYLVDCYTLHSASALAGNTVMRSIFGVVFPLFTVNMYNALGVQWAGSVVAFIALAFIPAPIIFYKYGAKIRMKSKYAREADAVNKALAAKAREAEESRLNLHSKLDSTHASSDDIPHVTHTDGGKIDFSAPSGRTAETGNERTNIDVDDVEKGMRGIGGTEGGLTTTGGFEEKLEEIEEVKRRGSISHLGAPVPSPRLGSSEESGYDGSSSASGQQSGNQWVEPMAASEGERNIRASEDLRVQRNSRLMMLGAPLGSEVDLSNR